MLKIQKTSYTLLILFLTLSCTVKKSHLSNHEQWTFSFEKSGCMDVCQAYSIRISNSGDYKYHGKFKVKHLGVKTGTLNPSELNQLHKLLESIHWNEIKNSYGENNKQQKVMVYNTISVNKKTSYYSGEPTELKALEHYLDTIIDKDEL